MASLGDDSALVQDDDRIGVEDGADALGYDKRDPRWIVRRQARLNARFRFDIDRAGAVVEDQDPGAEEQGPRDGQPLFLPAGKIRAAGLDTAVVTLGQGHDEFMGLGCFGGGHDVRFGGVRTAVADVVADGAGEKDGVLGNKSDRTQQGCLTEPPDVRAVDANASCSDVVEPGQEQDQAGLSGPCCSQDGRPHPGLDRQIDIFKDRRAAAVPITERDVLIIYPWRGARGQVRRIRGILNFRDGLHHFLKALGRGKPSGPNT